MKRKGKQGKKPYARKRFGQHFLTNRSIIDQTIAAAGIGPDDHIIEIGPGRGALTRPLLDQGASLTVVELDWDLAEALRHEFQDETRLRVVEGDILKLDWKQILQPGKVNRIVANLPYNISTPVFFKMVKYREQFASIVIMVQKELALRLQHTGKEKKIKNYGILSVVASNTFSVRKVCDVPPACFSPPPRVDSMVIRLEAGSPELPDEDAFFEFVKKAFNNRRKLFVSFLKREYGDMYDTLSGEEQDYLANLRPENLLPDQYLKLFQRRYLLDTAS